MGCKNTRGAENGRRAVRGIDGVVRDAAIIEIVGGAAEHVGTATVLVLAQEGEMVFAGQNTSGFGVVFDGIALQWDVDEVMPGGEEKS